MKDYDYYTVDEILQALESNSDEILTRASIISVGMVRKYGLAVEADDLFNEALVRILDDTRHVPKNVPLSYSIGYMIKSICQGMVERNQEKLFKYSESIEEYSESISVKNVDDDETDLRWEILFGIFSEDEVAIRFLTATQEGQNKSRIISSVFGGDEKAYDTTRRRIVRNGQKYLKEAG